MGNKSRKQERREGIENKRNGIANIVGDEAEKIIAFDIINLSEDGSIQGTEPVYGTIQDDEEMDRETIDMASADLISDEPEVDVKQPKPLFDSPEEEEFITGIADGIAQDNGLYIEEDQSHGLYRVYTMDDEFTPSVETVKAFYRFEAMRVLAKVLHVPASDLIEMKQKTPLIWSYKPIDYDKTIIGKNWNKREDIYTMQYRARFLSQYLPSLSRNIDIAFEGKDSYDEAVEFGAALIRNLTMFIEGLKRRNQDCYVLEANVLGSSRYILQACNIDELLTSYQELTDVEQFNKMVAAAVEMIVDEDRRYSNDEDVPFVEDLTPSSIIDMLIKLGRTVRDSKRNEMFKIFNNCNPAINSVFTQETEYTDEIAWGIRALSFIQFVYSHNFLIKELVETNVLHNKEYLASKRETTIKTLGEEGGFVGKLIGKTKSKMMAKKGGVVNA